MKYVLLFRLYSYRYLSLQKTFCKITTVIICAQFERQPNDGEFVLLKYFDRSYVTRLPVLLCDTFPLSVPNSLSAVPGY